MSHLGNFALGDTIDTKFTTINTSGIPTSLSGMPAASVYADNSTTEITAGITLTTDFDAVTGLNHVRVEATSANGFSDGSNYQIVITTGTVGSASVVGYVVGEFHIGAAPADATEINGISTSSVTTINANLGTTQPVNFTGTGASALAKSDAVDVGGTVQTGADIGAIFASNGVETGYALKDALRLIFAVLCGKSSGLPTSPVYRDVNDTKNRVSGTLDTSNNRTAVTLDAS